MAVLEQSVTTEKLFTRNFFLICFVTFGFFFGQFLTITTLPLYGQQLGGSPFEIGSMIGIATAVGVSIRLVIGREVDVRGSKIFLIIGLLVALVAMTLFIFAHKIIYLIALRGLLGVGVAFVSTAAISFVANIAPAHRRGEAMSYSALASSLANALAPPLGIALIFGSNFSPVFVAGAAIDLFALIMAIMLTEKRRANPTTATTVVRRNTRMIHRKSLLPGLIYFFHAVAMGTIISFMPILAVTKGLGNPGLFLTTYAVIIIILRATTGGFSDRFGRTAIIVPGMLSLALGLAILPFSTSTVTFLISALFFGIGVGWVDPTVRALTIDRCRPEDSGAAVATVNSSWDMGYIVGAVLLGLVLQLTSFTTIYVGAATGVLVGLAIYLVGVRKGW